MAKKNRVRGASGILAVFGALAKSMLPAGDRALEAVAQDLQSRAIALAPILTSKLIRSADIKRSPGRREVSFGTRYIGFIHNGYYNLGPLSRQKPATDDGPVGRQFLARPFNRHRKRYQALIGKSVTAQLRGRTRSKSRG